MSLSAIKHLKPEEKLSYCDTRFPVIFVSGLGFHDQNRLMNWGYAVCDAAIRRHIATLLPSQTAAPHAYPFPGGVG